MTYANIREASVKSSYHQLQQSCENGNIRILERTITLWCNKQAIHFQCAIVANSLRIDFHAHRENHIHPTHWNTNWPARCPISIKLVFTQNFNSFCTACPDQRFSLGCLQLTSLWTKLSKTALHPSCTWWHRLGCSEAANPQIKNLQVCEARAWDDAVLWNSYMTVMAISSCWRSCMSASTARTWCP